MNIGGGKRAVLRKGLVCCLLLVVVVPFAGKPPHIDEESYLFIGARVADAPLRPYDWWRAWQPLERTADSFIYAHPPLFLWWMGLLERTVGEQHLVWMRLAGLPFVLLLGLSFLRLAGRFTRSPGWVTLCFVMSPAVLLVLHQSLMIDLPYVALSVTAVTVLYAWRERGDSPRAWAAGVLMGLSALTKYPAIMLLALAFLDSRGRVRVRSGFLKSWRIVLASMGVLGSWELWTWHAYGYPHLWYVLSHAGEIERTPLLSRFAGNLAQLGWAAFAPPVVLVFLVVKGRGRRLALGVAGATVMSVVVFGPPMFPGVDFSGQVPGSLLLRVLLVLAFFLGISALTTLSLRTREDRFLALWAVVSSVAVLVGHNFASARYLVAPAAPLHLLLWRRIEEAGVGRALPRLIVPSAVVAGGVMSLVVAVADHELASVYPGMVEDLAERLPRWHGDGRVWFTGEWGFRYQMERLGLDYLQPGSQVEEGDVVVVPDTACPGDISWLEDAVEIERFEYPPGRIPVRTMARRAGIGFYSEAFGLLPYGPSRDPLETLSVYRVGRRPRSRSQAPR